MTDYKQLLDELVRLRAPHATHMSPRIVDRAIKLAEELHAEVERSKKSQTWQPIETAPKDWSDVLVYVPEGENPKGRWHEEKIWTAYFSGEDGGWNCWCVNGKKMENQPTHWMPLPAYEQARGGE